MSHRNIIAALLLLLPVFICTRLAAQNINGEKVIVGKESITIINFPDKVLNINFSDDAAYDYYIPKRREEKSISIQFNKEKTTAPNTGLLVNEGGRSHMFRLIFDSTYNINDDTRPPLWYDHSNLKELKAFVQKQKDDAANPPDEARAQREADEQRKKEKEQRQAEYAAAQEKHEKDQAEKAQKLEQQRAAEEAKQQQQAADIAKAKKDAEEKEKQLKLAADKEAADKKAAEEKNRKAAEDLAKQKAAEEQKVKLLQQQQAAEQAARDKQLKELKAKQVADSIAKEEKLKQLKAEKDAAALAKAQEEKLLQEQKAAEALEKARKEKELQEQKAAEALAKAQKAAEEKKRLEEERLAKQKALEEEKRQKAAEELARKEAEKKAAQERLAKLEEERREREAAKAYSEMGIWQRYGKRGINIYDIPPGYMNSVISDFYIARDTLRHSLLSDSVMKMESADKLNIEAGSLVNKGVKITLENIVFKEVYSYYKLKIENNSNEDFLMGKTYMYWYDANEKPIKMIKSSYITYISAFPLVKPHTVQQVVFVARSPNMTAGESLVLFIEDRRKEIAGTSIVIPSEAYNKELKKVQKDVKTAPVTAAPAADNGDKDGKKKRRGRE